MWIDVGMQVPGRDDLAHVAIFEHPDNMNYPQAWRVDDQLGVGSARTRTADWTIPQEWNIRDAYIKDGQASGKRLHVVAPEGPVRRLLEITGTASRFSLHGTRDDAFAAA